jgi:hypothetical protein
LGARRGEEEVEDVGVKLRRFALCPKSPLFWEGRLGPAHGSDSIGSEEPDRPRAGISFFGGNEYMLGIAAGADAECGSDGFFASVGECGVG